MHLGTRVLVVATSAVILLACGDAGGLREENVSSTSGALVDYDGTFTVSWNVNPAPNQGGYTHLLQRFNGGAWTMIYGAGLGPQSRTVTVTQYGAYDYKVDYAYIPANPCGYRYCIPGLIHGSQTLQTVHFIIPPDGGVAGASGGGGTAGSSGSAGQGGMSGGASGAGGIAGSSGSAGQGGMSGGTAGTGGAPCGNGVPDPGEECDDGNATGADGCEPDCTITDGTPCTSDADCSPGQSCAGGTCV
jgi:cysteine-rich repeat protein